MQEIQSRFNKSLPILARIVGSWDLLVLSSLEVKDLGHFILAEVSLFGLGWWKISHFNPLFGDFPQWAVVGVENIRLSSERRR